MLPDLSRSSGCIVYFFVLGLSYKVFFCAENPQPFDITLKAFQTRGLKAEYIMGKRIVIKFIT